MTGPTTTWAGAGLALAQAVSDVASVAKPFLAELRSLASKSACEAAIAFADDVAA
jgi:hypothetical protein